MLIDKGLVKITNIKKRILQDCSLILGEKNFATHFLKILQKTVMQSCNKQIVLLYLSNTDDMKLTLECLGTFF